MKDFVEKYKGGKYSQNGEAGIIDECIKRIGLIGGVAIEFGAPTKQYCSNIYHLSENPQWMCFWIDNDPKEEGIKKMTVTPENINELINCTIISMDTDGPDLELWTAYKGQPDIVIIEINSSLPPMVDFYSKEKGASYIAMLTIGLIKGYFLVAHTGNLLFIRNKYRKLFPDVIGDGIDNWEDYFKKDWLQ